MSSDQAREASIAIDDLLPLLQRAGNEELLDSLIGCALDDGINDDLIPIDGVDASAGVLVAGGRRIKLRQTRSGCVIDARPGHQLLAAINRLKTPQQRREEQVAKELAKRRVEAQSLESTVSREQVLAFLCAIEARRTPTERELAAFYDAMTPAPAARTVRRAAEALRSLLTLCQEAGRVPLSLPWRLAWCLRHTGDVNGAIAICELGEEHAPDGMDRAILATIHASALVERALLSNNRALLEEATRAADVAYRIDQSEHVRTVYKAIERARDRLRP